MNTDRNSNACICVLPKIASRAAVSRGVKIVTATYGLGVEELVVLFLLLLVLLGPRSPRELADVMIKAIHEFRQHAEWNTRTQSPGFTFDDLLILAVIFVACVAISWLTTLL